MHFFARISALFTDFQELLQVVGCLLEVVLLLENVAHLLVAGSFFVFIVRVFGNSKTFVEIFEGLVKVFFVF